MQKVKFKLDNAPESERQKFDRDILEAACLFT